MKHQYKMLIKRRNTIMINKRRIMTIQKKIILKMKGKSENRKDKFRYRSQKDAVQQNYDSNEDKVKKTGCKKIKYL